jgi:hypothetical protein
VLVVRPVQAGGDDGAVAGLGPDLDGSGRDDPGELDLVLDRAVGVEVPEEAVLVPTVAKQEMTSRRDRRTSIFSVRKSVCFQPTPKSSSCMQMAFGMVTGSPSWSLATASK